MSRKLFILATLIVLLLGASTIYAQNGPTPQHSDPTWQVSYWNNKTLAGDPLLQSTEANLDWNWGTGSPHASIPADGFSARWTRIIDVTAGSYRFTATADDGIRVYVDNNLIINQWHDHPAQTFTADISLSAGHHQVVVEYYENSGQAVAKLTWAPASVTPVNWYGEYFNNRTLSGAPVLVRDDAEINFNWGAGSPAAGLPADGFSARWTRTVNFPAGNYRFTTTSDDGVRLWVNGHLLIDKWVDQTASSHSGVIFLSGNVPLKLEYYENGGLASARLVWVMEGSTPPPTGAVIVDNHDSGFARGGTASSWRTATIGHGNGMIWTKNNDQVRPNYNWARWYPALTAARYEVFVYIPGNYATTTSARYWISHRDGYTLKIINQMSYSEQWVSLGTYRFQGNASDYVSLSDVTFESYLSRMIGFDAMKWEPR